MTPAVATAAAAISAEKGTAGGHQSGPDAGAYIGVNECSEPLLRLTLPGPMQPSHPTQHPEYGAALAAGMRHLTRPPRTAGCASLTSGRHAAGASAVDAANASALPDELLQQAMRHAD